MGFTSTPPNSIHRLPSHRYVSLISRCSAARLGPVRFARNFDAARQVFCNPSIAGSSQSVNIRRTESGQNCCRKSLTPRLTLSPLLRKSFHDGVRRGKFDRDAVTGIIMSEVSAVSCYFYETRIEEVDSFSCR